MLLNEHKSFKCNYLASTWRFEVFQSTILELRTIEALKIYPALRSLTCDAADLRETHHDLGEAFGLVRVLVLRVVLTHVPVALVELLQLRGVGQSSDICGLKGEVSFDLFRGFYLFYLFKTFISYISSLTFVITITTFYYYFTGFYNLLYLFILSYVFHHFSEGSLFIELYDHTLHPLVSQTVI